MEWSQKRRIFYSLIFVGVIILLAAYPIYRIAYKAPTCFDGVKNGDETGVDCGGGCSLVCVSDILAPRIVWSKAFPLNGGKYDVAAYVENVNSGAGLKNARYTIQVIDNKGAVLAEKQGATELAPGSRVLLFETGVSVSGVPDSVNAIFNSSDLTQWMKATTAASPVVTKNQQIINADSSPRFNAVLVNTDQVNDVTNLSLSAIIYDSYKNPIAVSKSFVDRIPKGSEQGIFFTWPNRFPNTSRNFITEILVTPRAIFVE